jgi:VanZ family protein
MSAPEPRRLRPAADIAAILAFACAAVLTHLPPAAALPVPNDSLAHFAGYAGLSALLWLCLWTRGRGAWRRELAVLIVMALYGAIDELTQTLTGRTPELGDWLFDMSGALLALAVMLPLGLLHARRR